MRIKMQAYVFICRQVQTLALFSYVQAVENNLLISISTPTGTRPLNKQVVKVLTIYTLWTFENSKLFSGTRFVCISNVTFIDTISHIIVQFILNVLDKIMLVPSIYYIVHRLVVKNVKRFIKRTFFFFFIISSTTPIFARTIIL